MYSPKPILMAPDTIAAIPVKTTMELLPVEINVAAATPIRRVKVEIKPSFNPKIIIRILPPPVMCYACLC